MECVVEMAKRTEDELVSLAIEKIRIKDSSFLNEDYKVNWNNFNSTENNLYFSIFNGKREIEVSVPILSLSRKSRDNLFVL